MEISELLRRGDFSRSKVFLSQSQFSVTSQEDDTTSSRLATTATAHSHTNQNTNSSSSAYLRNRQQPQSQRFRVLDDHQLEQSGVGPSFTSSQQNTTNSAGLMPTMLDKFYVKPHTNRQMREGTSNNNKNFKPTFFGNHDSIKSSNQSRRMKNGSSSSQQLLKPAHYNSDKQRAIHTSMQGLKPMKQDLSYATSSSIAVLKTESDVDYNNNHDEFQLLTLPFSPEVELKKTKSQLNKQQQQFHSSANPTSEQGFRSRRIQTKSQEFRGPSTIINPPQHSSKAAANSMMNFGSSKQSNGNITATQPFDPRNAINSMSQTVFAQSLTHRKNKKIIADIFQNDYSIGNTNATGATAAVGIESPTRTGGKNQWNNPHSEYSINEASASMFGRGTRGEQFSPSEFNSSNKKWTVNSMGVTTTRAFNGSNSSAITAFNATSSSISSSNAATTQSQNKNSIEAQAAIQSELKAIRHKKRQSSDKTLLIISERNSSPRKSTANISSREILKPSQLQQQQQLAQAQAQQQQILKRIIADATSKQNEENVGGTSATTTTTTSAIPTGTGSNSLSAIMGIVRAKKNMAEILKKNRSQSMNSNNPKENASEEKGNKEYDVLNFEKHDKVLKELRNDESGCEVYDIYGTFHDKLKNIQGQVFEAIGEYVMACAIIDEVAHAKKQSRVIDVVENTKCSILLSLEHLERVPAVINQREELDKILAQMAISQMKNSSASLLVQIETVMIYAKFNKEISNFGKALRLFKQCKNMAVSAQTMGYRMRSYAAIGICFQNLKLYALAMVYFGKYLENAWYVGDKEAELGAYDLIGVTSYLSGDLETAKFYHEKMLQNDNEPEDSTARQLSVKKIVEKLKKINSEEYSSKISLNYKKFFAKIHSSDYTEDYQCSSSDDDEFKISIPKTSSQKANKDYQQYLIGLGPAMKRKAEQDQKRFIAIFNAEDRQTQQNIKRQANENIHLEEVKRNTFGVPNSIKHNLQASSFKPIANSQKTPFRINQFTINRNLENYLCQDSKIQQNSHLDFFKLVEDTNDRKVKEKIITILSQFQSNLIFALSLIHCKNEKAKHSKQRRRFAFSGTPISTGEVTRVKSMQTITLGGSTGRDNAGSDQYLENEQESYAVGEEGREQGKSTLRESTSQQQQQQQQQQQAKNLLQMNIDIAQTRLAGAMKSKKKVEPIENRSKPNSNKERIMVLQRYQMHHQYTQK